MNTRYAESITRARSLYDGFYDVIHDWEHSQRVAVNARLIAHSIGYEDEDFLTLCALWHDTARTLGIVDGHEEAGALLAEKDMIQHGEDAALAERVYEAIRFHKSSSNPLTVEGKIIRDADKLDIFTVARWKKCTEAGWIKEYADDFRRTIASRGKYPDAFTYEFTKQQFNDRLPNFLRYYESVKDQLPV